MCYITLAKVNFDFLNIKNETRIEQLKSVIAMEHGFNCKYNYM